MKQLLSNIINLKYFFDTVRTNSFGESAKCNHVTQSAISQAVSKLENDLNCQLFTRQPGNCKVTEKGFLLFEQAREIFQTLHRAEEAITEQKGGTITIGCTHSFAIGPLSSYLMLARKKLPGLQINFRLGHYCDIKEWIKKGVIDFGILLDNDDLSYFECIKIFHGHFSLYASKSCKDVQDLGFLLDTDERKESNLLRKDYIKKYGRELPVSMEVSSWEVIANLTVAGFGIGQFPDYVAQSRKSKLKLVYKKLNAIPYTLYALFKKNKTPNPHALQFCQLLSHKNLQQ